MSQLLSTFPSAFDAAGAAAASSVAVRNTPDKFVDPHTGWKVGDIVVEAGVNYSVTFTFTTGGIVVNTSDGTYNSAQSLYLQLFEIGSNQTVGAIIDVGSVFGASNYSCVCLPDGTYSDADLASALANVVNATYPFLVASSSGAAMTAAWNDPGMPANPPVYTVGDGGAQLSVNLAIQPGISAGNFLVVDPGNLNNSNGYIPIS